MHPVQKHTGDRLLDTKANWIYMNMKGAGFQPRVLQLNLDNIKTTPAQQIPQQKKSRNLPAQESNPQPSAC